MIYKFPYYADWVVVDTKSDNWKEMTNEQRHAIEHRVECYNANQLAYFIPHGVPWSDTETPVANGELILPASDYPAEWGNDGVAFLNDWESDINIMLGPNQNGKSKILAAWTGYHIVPCDPSWEVYTRKKHRLVYPEWTGPKTWVVASYNWDNVATFFTRIRETFPQYELQDHCLNGKDIPFGDGKPKRLKLACGSQIIFLCYDQRQSHWEAFDCDGASLDEQCPHDKFTGLDRATTTKGDYTPFAMALTGHRMEDRPDTGAAGWIKSELCDADLDEDGKVPLGYKVAVRHLSVESTPDAIVTPERKKKLWKKWADPEVKRTKKMQSEAIARYWGGWEEGSGRVFDTDYWNPRLHIIPPLWTRPEDTPGPEKATLYRVIDHGDSRISACTWFAVTKYRTFAYRYLYRKNISIADMARLVVEMSGNEWVRSGSKTDLYGNSMACYVEVVKNERIFRTIMDSRSRSSKAGRPEDIGAMFSRYGIETTPASGKHNSKQIPVLKSYMQIDYNAPHPYIKDQDGKHVMGCSRMLFFDLPEGRKALKEFDNMRYSPTNPDKLDPKCDDHFIDTCKYFCTAEGVGFWGSDEWDAPSDAELQCQLFYDECETESQHVVNIDMFSQP